MDLNEKTRTIVSGLVAVTLLASNVASLKVFAEEQNLSLISSQPSKDINLESIPKLNISNTATSQTDESLDVWMPDKVVQLVVAKTLGIAVTEITKEAIGRTYFSLNSRNLFFNKGYRYLLN